MKVWVFEVNRDWDYCGGAVVIVAESIAQCQELFKAECKARGFGHNQYYLVETQTEVDPGYACKNSHDSTFVLVGAMPVDDAEVPRVVVASWNYA